MYENDSGCPIYFFQHEIWIQHLGHPAEIRNITFKPGIWTLISNNILHLRELFIVMILKFCQSSVWTRSKEAFFLCSQRAEGPEPWIVGRVGKNEGFFLGKNRTHLGFWGFRVVLGFFLFFWGDF